MNSKLQRPLRNIGVIAHVDAGKTTLTERILYYAGLSHRMGEVHQGNTQMDFDPQERQRGITISSAAVTVPWQGVQINLIDTPGHIDFNIEVRRSLRVLDGAVVVLDGVAGVEPQTETNWRLADDQHVPRIVFVNKLDRPGADFGRALDQVRDRLGANAVALQWPIGQEAGFVGVVDLLTQTSLVWARDDAQAPPVVGEVPQALQAQVLAQRTRLIEAVVEHDDALMDAYLTGQVLDTAALQQALRRGVLAGALVPVLAGSAFKNRGIEPLLDAVVACLPAPQERTLPEAGLQADAALPLAALAFKVVADGPAPMVFVRLYQGRLRRGDAVLNAVTGQTERVSRLLQVQADKHIDLQSVQAGDIVAIVGLKDTLTGHTLCDPGHPLLLESIEVPLPVIDLAIEARTRADQAGLSAALARMVREDPSLRVRSDAESGQLLLSGMGELQLEVAVERLRARHGIAVLVGQPQVALRETITRTVEVDHVHKKQSGGPGQFAALRLRLAPLPRGEGQRFESEIVGGAVPREFIPAVKAGVMRAAQAGVLAGHPCVDFVATLVDGNHHARDSSALAFELAAADAFGRAARLAQPVLLEPVMAVEVTTPADDLGDCLGDLHRRRGRVRGQGQRGDAVVIDALVPLQSMFGYIGNLRALSQGRASYGMQFSHYQAAPVTDQAAVA